MKTKTLNWKPIRRGEIYCSSACGGHCTFAAYEAAVKAAKSCLRRMKTKGWKIHVHENLGWFWQLTHEAGLITVAGGQPNYRENPNTRFHAMLSSSGHGGCDSAWCDDKRFNDPNKAVSHRLKLAKAHITNLQRSIEGISGAYALERVKAI